MQKVDIAEAKKALRRQVRALKAEMSDEEKRSASAEVISAFEALPEFAAAGIVLSYASMPDELGTEAFIQRWCQKKRIVLPVVIGNGLELREYDPEHLVAGYKGIMEPDASCAVFKPEDIALAMVPGMAFDSDGHRLGRGGGFYDRLLPALKCNKIGVCFPCQMVEEVPVEDFDSIMDLVIYGSPK